MLRLALRSLGSLVLVVGCGPSDPPVDGGGSGGSSGPTSTTAGGSGPLGSTGPAMDGTGSDGTTDHDGTTSGCEGVCFVDFPCNGSERGCVDPTTIEVWESESVDDCSQVRFGCEDACSCMGSSCEPRDPQPCSADTWCVEQGDAQQPRAECLPAAEVCGGPEGLTCEADEHCEYSEALCPECLDAPEGCGPGSPLGWCVPRPAPDADCGPEVPGQEQCGCDGTTYANECERLRAGVALADDSACA